MASEMSLTQNFRQLTLTLPADSVTVNVDIKMLKGQYTYSLTNNYTDLSFDPWSEDHEASETFLKIVREMQIEPNSYYLEMVMNQSLVNNFAINCIRPKMTTIEQDASQENETNRQSPCPSNWSDYLCIEDDMDNESPDQTETPTDPNQPTTSTGTHIPQDYHNDMNAISRLPQSVPKDLAIQKEKGKGKHNITEAMPIVVVGNVTQLWEQRPSPPKTRPDMRLHGTELRTWNKYFI